MSLNIFEIWDNIGRQTPFAVRRDNWTEEYYTVVEKIECKKMPYGKAFGYPTINGEYSDHYNYDKQWLDEKLIPCCGCYQWSLAENAEANKGMVVIEMKPTKPKVKVYSADSVFDFGKYKNTSVEEVFRQNPDYSIWTIVNVNKFSLTKQALGILEAMTTNFKFKDGVLQINEKKLLQI